MNPVHGTVHKSLGKVLASLRSPEQAVRDRLAERTMSPQAAREFLVAAGLTGQCIDEILAGGR